MEVTIKILELDLKSHCNNGCCNLHCTVQTASDKFVESSLLELDNTNQLAAGNQWPTFTYTFNKQYMQMSVTFLTTTVTTDGSQEEMGKGFSPLVLSSKKSELSIRETILVSKVTDFPLFVNTGKIIYKVSFKLNPLSNSEEGPAQTGSKYWLGLSNSRQNLPLLNNLELVHTFSEVEETEVFLKMREEEQKMSSANNGLLMPNTDQTVTVIFHTFASSWNTDTFNPVACLVKGEETTSIGTSCADWYWNELETMGELTEGNIMKVVNFKIQSPLYRSTRLYLFKDDISGPVFHAIEPLQSLAPFCFHHRGWLQNISQATVPSDSFIHSSIHILSSIHLLPSKADYEDYEGFELLFTDLSFDETIADPNNGIVLGAEITRISNATKQNLDEKTSQTGFTPSFLEGRGHEHNRGDNFKMSLYNPLGSSTSNNWKAYFFCPENEAIVKEEMEDGVTLALIIHVCIIDRSSSLPWWFSCHHYQAQLPISAFLYNVLLMDTINGIKWSPSWERSGNIRQCSVDIALRWKPKELPFLSHSDNDKVNSFHDFNTLLHNASSLNIFNYNGGDIYEEFNNFSQHSLFDFENHQMSSSTIMENQRPSMMHTLAAPSRVTFDMPETDSGRQQSGHFNERGYKAALETLSEEVLRLKYKNEQLEQEKVNLNDEIKQLKMQTNDTAVLVSPLNMRELDNLVKPDLIHKVILLERELESEKTEKNAYRQRVQSIQNELIQKNDNIAEFDRLQDNHGEQQQVIIQLKRKVEKYRKCFKTAIQQEKMLTKLEELIIQLPQDQHGRIVRHDRNEEIQYDPRHSDEGGQENGLLPIIMDPFMRHNIHCRDNNIIHDTQVQQAFGTMNSEIVRLRHENNQLHSHLASIIKAFKGQTRKQEQRQILLEDEAQQTTTDDDGQSIESERSTALEQLQSF